MQEFITRKIFVNAKLFDDVIGKLKDGGNGTKLLVGKNDEVIREFKTDGSIISVTA